MFVMRPADTYAYAYLLGLYLGDGHLAGNGRSWQLIVSLDGAHEQVIEECQAAMVLTLPARIPRLRRHPKDRCVRVASMAKAWRELLPQHGPGRKHERPIVLAPWQQHIVDEHTWQFVRGLIHSDGRRSVNRFKTRLPSGRVAEYAYPRYFFSNLSPDIGGLFCSSCDRLGLRWTSPITATSPSRIVRASRCWTSTSARSPDPTPRDAPLRRPAGGLCCATAACGCRASGAARGRWTCAPAP
jgi:hypothetical protein